MEREQNTSKMFVQKDIHAKHADWIAVFQVDKSKIESNKLARERAQTEHEFVEQKLKLLKAEIELFKVQNTLKDLMSGKGA